MPRTSTKNPKSTGRKEEEYRRSLDELNALQGAEGGAAKRRRKELEGETARDAAAIEAKHSKRPKSQPTERKPPQAARSQAR